MPRIARATNAREASTRKAARKFESHQYMVTAADKRCRDEMRHSGNAAGDYSGGAAGYYSGNAAGNYSGNAAATTAATPLVTIAATPLNGQFDYDTNNWIMISFLCSFYQLCGYGRSSEFMLSPHEKKSSASAFSFFARDSFALFRKYTSRW